MYFHCFNLRLYLIGKSEKHTRKYNNNNNNNNNNNSLVQHF